VAWGIVGIVTGLSDSRPVFVLLNFAFAQQDLDIWGIVVECRVVEVFQGRVITVFPEFLALAAVDILVKDNADGDGAVVQWNKPGPARLIFQPQRKSACSSSNGEGSLTLQRLEIGSVFSVGPGLVLVAPFPVTPKCGVFESVINLAVLQVRRGHNAATSRCINEVVELDRAAFTLDVGPLGGCRTSGIWVTFENEAVDFGLFNDLGTELSSVTEHHLIGLRTNLQGIEVGNMFATYISCGHLPRSMTRGSSRG
jgi:hypothetical protein